MTEAHTKPDRRSRCCNEPWYSSKGRYVCAGCEAHWQGRSSEMPDLGDQTFQPTDPVEIEQKRNYLKTWALAHKVHHTSSATDDTFIKSHHTLCPICNPDLLKGDGRPWLRRETATITVRTVGAPAPTTMATTAGLVEALAGRAADKSSWAYEPRQAYLRRKLEHFPDSAPGLISKGLWTGTYDGDGQPTPDERAFHSGLWQREVWPVYNGPEPTLNKMRSLRDTLIVSPESGPRLIACGLWTGDYDPDGLPIPT